MYFNEKVIQLIREYGLRDVLEMRNIIAKSKTYEGFDAIYDLFTLFDIVDYNKKDCKVVFGVLDVISSIGRNRLLDTVDNLLNIDCNNKDALMKVFC